MVGFKNFSKGITQNSAIKKGEKGAFKKFRLQTYFDKVVAFATVLPETKAKLIELKKAIQLLS